MGVIDAILRPFSRWTQNKIAVDSRRTVEFDPADFTLTDDPVLERTVVTSAGAGSATPLSNGSPNDVGTAAAGVSTSASRADHVHGPAPAVTADASTLAKRGTAGEVRATHFATTSTGIAGQGIFRSTAGPLTLAAARNGADDDDIILARLVGDALLLGYTGVAPGGPVGVEIQAQNGSSLAVYGEGQGRNIVLTGMFGITRALGHASGAVAATLLRENGGEATTEDTESVTLCAVDVADGATVRIVYEVLALADGDRSWVAQRVIGVTATDHVDVIASESIGPSLDDAAVAGNVALAYGGGSLSLVVTGKAGTEVAWRGHLEVF